MTINGVFMLKKLKAKLDAKAFDIVLDHVLIGIWDEFVQTGVNGFLEKDIREISEITGIEDLVLVERAKKEWDLI